MVDKCHRYYWETLLVASFLNISAIQPTAALSESLLHLQDFSTCFPQRRSGESSMPDQTTASQDQGDWVLYVRMHIPKLDDLDHDWLVWYASVICLVC